MADTPVTDEDQLTKALCQIKLVLDVVGAMEAVWFFFNLTSRGQLNYLVMWHYRQWQQRSKAEKRLRTDIGRVLFEAQRVLETHGRA